MKKVLIQTLWIGSELSNLERLSISSFIRDEHEFHLYTYGEVSNVPEGVVYKDANEIIPQSEVFRHKKGSYAIFADWFRWLLLYKKGGFWVDTDMVCLKPFLFESDVVFGFESEGAVCNAVLSFPLGHELPKHLADICESPNTFLEYDSFKDKKRKLKRRLLSKGRSDVGWGEAGGPKGFTRSLRHFGLVEKAMPFTHFYPVHSSNWNSIFDETLGDDIELFKNTYAIHLWNEMSKRSPVFDKNADFPQGSLFEKMKTRFGV